MNDNISAFAFNTGREIEKIIEKETENLKGRNQILEARLLQWYMKTKDEEFAKHFGITSQREGKL